MEKLCGATTLGQLQGLLWGEDLDMDTGLPWTLPLDLISEVPFTIPTKPGLLSIVGGHKHQPLGPQNPRFPRGKCLDTCPRPWGPSFLGSHWVPPFRD